MKELLSDSVERKFTESFSCDDWEIESHDGWRNVISSNKTIPYQVYLVTLSNGMSLECADTHILIKHDMQEVFAKDSLGAFLVTSEGISQVIGVECMDREEEMYDLSVDGDNLYFTDGILSHNTTTLGMDILHDVIFNEDYRVGITSYKNANVLDFMDRIRFAYENLPWWMKPACVVYNKFSVSFDNGSSVRSQVTAENTFRGTSLNRIISDELAFTKPAIANEFIASLMPSLMGNGEQSETKLNVISTPNGTEGAFPSIWFSAVSGDNGFFPVEVKYEEIPNRTPEFESSMVKKIGRDKFDQEYRNFFLGSGGTLCNSRIMEAIVPMDPLEEIGDLVLFVSNMVGRKIAVACDVAEGVGEDNHVMQIFDIESFEQIGEYANNHLPQTMYFKDIVKVLKLLFERGAAEVYYTVEANGIGQGIMRLIETSENPVLQEATMIHDVDQYGISKRIGMLTTGKSKQAGCAQLKDLVELNIMKINSKKLLTELKFFVKKGTSFEAETGAKDDRVMACVIFANMLPQLANYEDSVDTTINHINEDEEVWGIMF